MPETLDFKDLIALYRAAKNPETLREFQRTVRARIEAASAGSETVFADGGGVFEEAPPKPATTLETAIRFFTKQDLEKPMPQEAKRKRYFPGIPSAVQKVIWTTIASAFFTGKPKGKG